MGKNNTKDSNINNDDLVKILIKVLDTLNTINIKLDSLLSTSTYKHTSQKYQQSDTTYCEINKPNTNITQIPDYKTFPKGQILSDKLPRM